MTRSLSLLLCLSIAAPAWPQAVAVSAPLGPAAPVAAAPSVLLGGIRTGPGLTPSSLSPSLGMGLPSVAAPSLKPSVSPASIQAIPSGGQAVSAGRAVAASPAAEASPARSAAPAVAQPSAAAATPAAAPSGVAARAASTVSGRTAASPQDRQADREAPVLKQLSGSLDAPSQAPARLDGLFDGGGRGAPSSVEEFARHAERAFAGGALRPGQTLAVAASKDLGGVRTQGVPGDQEMYDRVALSPLTNEEREKVVIELFQKAGAKPEDIQLQDTGDGTHNIFVVKKGRTDRVVVVGSHHDKADVGHGTIDNWTGATMVANLYQALRDVPTEATYVFAAFSKEELGLLGSRAFIKKLTPEQKAKIDSMVNLDTLAVDGTYSWQNNSDKSLLERIKKVAAAAALKLAEMTLWGGDADSSSFRRAGIPAITVLGASLDVLWDIVHTPKDTIAAFSLEHYKNAFQVVLALLKSLDTEPIQKPGRLARTAAGLTARLRAAFA